MTAPVLVFVGAKGGTGASTVCTELAKSMRGEVDVALVDADVNGRRTAGIAFDAARRLDAAHDRQGHVASVRLGRLTIVELAASYEDSFALAADEVESATAALQGFGVALVDAPLPFSARVRPFIVRLTRAMVVTEPTLAGMTAARTMAAQLRSFGVPPERIALIVNGRADGVRVNREEIERSAGAPVLAVLPDLNERGFASGVCALSKDLRALEPEEMLTGLFPSETGQTRDKRTARVHEHAAQRHDR